jgi:hypothetical protein
VRVGIIVDRSQLDAVQRSSDRHSAVGITL